MTSCNPDLTGKESGQCSVMFGRTTVTAVEGDITEQAVDAIVNSANTWMAFQTFSQTQGHRGIVSVHSPDFKPKGPSPTMSLIGSKHPGDLNSSVVPRGVPRSQTQQTASVTGHSVHITLKYSRRHLQILRACPLFGRAEA
jgi:hypothetical protein